MSRPRGSESSSMYAEFRDNKSPRDLDDFTASAFSFPEEYWALLATIPKQHKYMRAVCESSVWEQCVRAMCESNVWEQCVMCESSVWEQYENSVRTMCESSERTVWGDNTVGNKWVWVVVRDVIYIYRWFSAVKWVNSWSYWKYRLLRWLLGELSWGSSWLEIRNRHLSSPNCFAPHK